MQNEANGPIVVVGLEVAIGNVESDIDISSTWICHACRPVERLGYGKLLNGTGTKRVVVR